MKSRLSVPRSLIGLTFVVLGGANAVVESAHADSGGQCAALFLSRFKYIPAGVPVNRPTVKIAGTFENESGETFYRLRKLLEEVSWQSGYSTPRMGPNGETLRGYDIQGNPANLIETLGSDLARVLGVGWNKNGELLAPTPATLMRRIEKFNAFLTRIGIEPIQMRFYLQGKPQIDSFLQAWSDSMGVPVAIGQTLHTIHDISFHYAGVVLPAEIGRLLQAEAGLSLGWRKTNVTGFAPRLVRDVVANIDSTSTSNNGISELPAEVLATFFVDYFGRFSRPIETEWAHYAKLFSPIDIFHRKLLIDTGRFMAENSAANLELAFLRERERDENPIAAFIKRMKFEHPEWNRSLADLGLQDFETVQRLYSERKKNLRQAARKFLGEP